MTLFSDLLVLRVGVHAGLLEDLEELFVDAEAEGALVVLDVAVLVVVGDDVGADVEVVLGLEVVVVVVLDVPDDLRGRAAALGLAVDLDRLPVGLAGDPLVLAVVVVVGGLQGADLVLVLVGDGDGRLVEGEELEFTVGAL